MSERTERPTTCSGVRAQFDSGCDHQLLVESLADPTARRVYEVVTAPTTVAEVVAALDLPESTAYRTVHRLERAGLLRRLPSSSRGQHPDQYVRRIDRVSITVDDGVRIDCRLNGREVHCEPSLPSR